MQQRALPVRHAAAKSVLILIRCLRKLEQREQLIHLMIDGESSGILWIGFLTVLLCKCNYY